MTDTDPSSYRHSTLSFLFFFNDTATTEIYTLSLHDALPIYPPPPAPAARRWRTWHRAGARARAAIRAGRATRRRPAARRGRAARRAPARRSEEHTSELQSLAYLVCRLLLEKKK